MQFGQFMKLGGRHTFLSAKRPERRSKNNGVVGPVDHMYLRNRREEANRPVIVDLVSRNGNPCRFLENVPSNQFCHGLPKNYPCWLYVNSEDQSSCMLTVGM